MSNIKNKIIIDTDPGIDDAIALAIASYSENIDLKLVTTVSGNVNIDNVTNNTVKLFSFYGKNIPIAKGAATPLIRKPKDASSVHGKTGLEGFEFKGFDDTIIVKGTCCKRNV